MGKSNVLGGQTVLVPLVGRTHPNKPAWDGCCGGSLKRGAHVDRGGNPALAIAPWQHTVFDHTATTLAAPVVAYRTQFVNLQSVRALCVWLELQDQRCHHGHKESATARPAHEGLRQWQCVLCTETWAGSGWCER